MTGASPASDSACVQAPVRVAVAAAGATTCLAGSADSTWRKVRAGESGLGPLTLFDPGSTGRSGTVGEVAGHAGLTGGPRLAALAEAALTEALAEAEAAGVDRTELTGAWVTVGVSLGDIFEQSGPDVELDHFWGVVAARLGLTGPVVVLSSACSSGTDAVGYGADLVASGIAPVVVAVGVDSLEPGKYTGHSGLKTMSPDRCRPYDADGDGTTLAEGACALVLTDADRLPGTPLAELRGWAASTDIDALTSPDLSGEGAARMLRTALERAGGTPADVAHLNGHGSGTPVNDELEAAVYTTVFPERDVPVSGTKGALGHSLGATGAVEALLTAYALRERVAPPTAGLRVPHARWAGAPVATGEWPLPLPEGRPLGVSVTYGFGGANSCLVLAAGGAA
ncbi:MULTISPECIES: beta-ketoacyl synthase N-terminal-like domain-containing protein [unclassified Streptomyces]|uniref:Beta-ketoacyl synthase N-terminal-like domain-containing protein n=1 Tax=Streptomyces thermocoprophilus TaxID=78356 RepID=A0ABV5VG48_9ACTN